MLLLNSNAEVEQAAAGVFIRQMTIADLASVIRIHCDSFPGSRSTELGQVFLRKMYRWFMKHYPDLALVAIGGVTPIGFVTGSLGSYSHRMFRYTLPEIALGFISNPRLLIHPRMFSLWRSFMKGLFTRTAGSAKTEIAGAPGFVASLGSIAVSSESRGRRVGDALMLAFENAARQQKAVSLFLSVKADNKSARRLYENCGWTLVQEDAGQNSAVYVKEIR